MTAKKTSSSKEITASKKAPAKKATAKRAPAKKKIDEGLIRQRAQEIYMKRMEEGTPGDADTDWLQAEEELKNS